MLLLRTIAIGTGSTWNNILNFKLVRLEVYMVKLCHEKMLILRCTLENLEHPDKKLNSLGITLIP